MCIRDRFYVFSRKAELGEKLAGTVFALSMPYVVFTPGLEKPLYPLAVGVLAIVTTLPGAVARDES